MIVSDIVRIYNRKPGNGLDAMESYDGNEPYENLVQSFMVLTKICYRM